MEVHMIVHDSLRKIARSISQRQWRSHFERHAGTEVPAMWDVDDIVPLLNEHDMPTEELTSQIRRKLIERQFLDCSGDAADTATRHTELERQVQLAIDVLEEVRQYGLL